MVAREQLIGTQPGKCNLHMLRRSLRYQKCVQPIARGLIHGAHKLRKLRSHLQTIHQHFSMIRVTVRGHKACVTALVNAAALGLKANRKSLEPRAADARHQRNHCRRIHAARKKRTHRHICNHAQANSFLQQPAQLAARLFIFHALAGHRRGWHVPVFLHGHAACLPSERVARQQGLHTSQHCVRRRH